MKTIRRKTRKGRKKARTTGIMQQILAAILLTILAGSHVVAPTAYAGFLDWDWIVDRANDVQPVLADQGINKMFLGAPVYAPNDFIGIESTIIGHTQGRTGPARTARQLARPGGAHASLQHAGRGGRLRPRRSARYRDFLRRRQADSAERDRRRPIR